MLVLFETPAGYAIFKVRIWLFGVKEILLFHPKIVVFLLAFFLIGIFLHKSSAYLVLWLAFR